MTENLKLKNIYKVSRVIALTLGILFFLTALAFVISIIWPNIKYPLYLLFQSNWLISIFKLHCGLINIQDDPLSGLNIMDITILALFSIFSFGLSKALKEVNKIWPLISFALSVITIVLFIVTQIAGRSTIMLSVMIFSFVMLKNKAFSKVTIYSGIFASIFLFAGDLTVGINSIMISILFGIGYVLLTIWFFLIYRKPLWLRSYKNEQSN